MAKSDNDRTGELECLRLASDLTQLANATLNPHLRAHCLRMAKLWSGEADEKPAEYAGIAYAGIQSVLLH
jgi:hypothetical protein